MNPFALMVIQVVLPIVFPFIVAGAGYLYKKAIQGLPADKQAIVSNVVRTVVTATEQTAVGAFNGAAKKQVALEEIDKVLSHLHVTASPALINSLIEEAVFALNKSSQSQSASLVSVPLTPSPSPSV